MPEPSILDARLAEIDRRLRTIQSGLQPAGAPAAVPPAPPVQAPPAPPIQTGTPIPPDPVSAPTPLRAVAAPAPALTPAEEADRLITRLRGLVSEHERLLGETREMLTAADGAGVAAVALSAGPFTETAQLKGFAQAVMGLPGVREVVVREYAGGDRAVIDVHLTQPIS